MRGLSPGRRLIGMREGVVLKSIADRWLWWGLGRVFGAGIGSSSEVGVELLPGCVGKFGQRGACLLQV